MARDVRIVKVHTPEQRLGHRTNQGLCDASHAEQPRRIGTANPQRHIDVPAITPPIAPVVVEGPG